MIKAIFLDLDGTLLDSKKKISFVTGNALIRCKEKGIKVFVSTARHLLLKEMLMLSNEEEELLRDGGIYYNGGCVCYDEKKEYTEINSQTVSSVMEILLTKSDVNIAVQMINEKHSFRYQLNEEEFKTWGLYRNNIIPFDEFNYEKVVKIYAFSSKEKLDGICELINLVAGKQTNIYLTDNQKAIQIISGDTNKYLAAQKIIKHYKFNKDEIAVFGDDTNDIEMLNGFKYSVAMGNSAESVKKIAKYVTLSNDEDGIDYALRNILKVI